MLQQSHKITVVNENYNDTNKKKYKAHMQCNGGEKKFLTEVIKING